MDTNSIMRAFIKSVFISSAENIVKEDISSTRSKESRAVGCIVTICMRRDSEENSLVNGNLTLVTIGLFKNRVWCACIKLHYKLAKILPTGVSMIMTLTSDITQLMAYDIGVID